MARRVLILGSDRTLLETRREVLETNGIEAETLLGDAGLDRAIELNTPALLVACSSLDRATRKAALNIAHRSSAKVRCLVIESRTDTSQSPSDLVTEDDLVMGAFESPEAFVLHVSRLIAD